MAISQETSHLSINKISWIITHLIIDFKFPRDQCVKFLWSYTGNSCRHDQVFGFKNMRGANRKEIGRFHINIVLCLCMWHVVEMLLMIYTWDFYCNTIVYHLTECFNCQIVITGTIFKLTAPMGTRIVNNLSYSILVLWYAIWGRRKKTALENVRNCVGFPMKVVFFLQD